MLFDLFNSQNKQCLLFLLFFWPIFTPRFPPPRGEGPTQQTARSWTAGFSQNFPSLHQSPFDKDEGSMQARSPINRFGGRSDPRTSQIVGGGRELGARDEVTQFRTPVCFIPKINLAKFHATAWGMALCQVCPNTVCHTPMPHLHQHSPVHECNQIFYVCCWLFFYRCSS